MLPTHLSPYLIFDGQCRDAMQFYQSCLGGKLTMQTYGEAPMPGTPENYKEKILHAMLENDSLSFMASDVQPDGTVIMGTNVHLTIAGTDEKRIREIFGKLGEGGTVTMKLDKQFWGDVYGTLTDKFGVHWMFNISEKKN